MWPSVADKKGASGERRSVRSERSHKVNWESPDSVTFAYGNVRMWELIQLSHCECESAVFLLLQLVPNTWGEGKESLRTCDCGANKVSMQTVSFEY